MGNIEGPRQDDKQGKDTQMEERYTILTLGTVRDTKREIRQNNEGTLIPSIYRERERERAR